MRTHRVPLFLLLALGLVVSAYGQQLSRRDLQALVILQTSFAAMGGGNLVAIRDTEILAQVTAPRDDGMAMSAVKMWTLGTRNLRIESTSADGPAVLVVNEQAASMKAGGEAAQFIPRRSVANGGITHIPLLSILSDWSDPSTQLEYVGIEKLGNSPVHHVRITQPVPADVPKEVESPCEIFIDSQSLLVVKLVYLMRPPENLRISVPVEVTYSDYRPTAGIAVPFQIRYTLRGQLLRQYQVTSFAVNRGAQASDFDVK